MTRARTLSKLGNPDVFTVDTSNNVGVNSTSPTEKLNVVGVVSATSFFGSGANLTGIANTAIISSDQINVTGVVTATSFVGSGANLTGVSGFATALSNDTSNILNKVFKTPITLEIASDTTVNSDAASDFLAFVREGRLHVQSGQVFTVGSGTTFVMNVLGIFP
tara:strand:+ start:111 stop:602 length:492 start_codon:yes stop_codon:yes gene_type:complete